MPPGTKMGPLLFQNLLFSPWRAMNFGPYKQTSMDIDQVWYTAFIVWLHYNFANILLLGNSAVCQFLHLLTIAVTMTLHVTCIFLKMEELLNTFEEPRP